jgi:hypothetical protein
MREATEKVRETHQFDISVKSLFDDSEREERAFTIMLRSRDDKKRR